MGSGSDFIELGLAAVLVGLYLVRGPHIAEKTWWCMGKLAILPIALRLIRLAHHPAPTPDLPGEFSHLLVAYTLRHFRLANPVNALHQFFETFFCLAADNG